MLVVECVGEYAIVLLKLELGELGGLDEEWDGGPTPHVIRDGSEAKTNRRVISTSEARARRRRAWEVWRGCPCFGVGEGGRVGGRDVGGEGGSE